jgi:hypothetical protein
MWEEMIHGGRIEWLTHSNPYVLWIAQVYTVHSAHTKAMLKPDPMIPLFVYVLEQQRIPYSDAILEHTGCDNTIQQLPLLSLATSSRATVVPPCC